MARASALSKALVAAGALMALRLLSGETFVTPKQRNEAAAAMAAAMVAASAPAMAEDAYSQNDNPINPYSQFSDGSDTVYQAKNQPEVERRTKSLKAGLKRFEDTPGYIQTKQAQALKSNLQESNSLRQDLL
ncbi:Bifunctional lysine-specific demethylase and histidyl-hydroxylase, partial [Durusdinium trenchii]